MILDINHNTGISVIYITPDGERTMNTHMGASVKLVPDDITSKALEDIKGSFVEGYIYYSEYGVDIITKLFTETRRVGGFNAISLSDINCVQSFRNEFLNLLEENKVDLLFGNKKEMMHLFEVDDERSLNFQLERNSTQYCTIIMTNGKNGCVIAQNHEIKFIPTNKIKNVIDTTGAGDLFVSGFLKGYINGSDVIKCSQMGNYYASEIIQIIGGKISKDSISRIRENFLEF
jgi:sugar/nucleoside kinase (ribokinase family)